MPTLTDHPKRYQLSNELHARPFPTAAEGSRALFLALKQPNGGTRTNAQADLDHLLALLDRYGAAHPGPGATHYFGTLGRFRLKWERHTEFVTYTILLDGLGDRPFDPADFDLFEESWLADAPGERVVSALIRIEPRLPLAELKAKMSNWFVLESLAASEVLDGAGVIAGDFHIDPAGHTRFAIFASDGVGQARIGRIVQRLFEIETYKSMAMLGFARMREMEPLLGDLETKLSRLIEEITLSHERAEDQLDALLGISAELEAEHARSAFRFGATGAYETIVNQRIFALRETPLEGQQTLAEFMMRRFDPAMRTVKSSERRLHTLSERAVRAAQLLRTRVDVDRSAQNQKLLESMNRRADLQLKLQHTVEGLSVVAITYYAVSLGSYLLAPLAGHLGASKAVLTAGITLPVAAIVWWMVRRIRHRASG
ncbi:MAG: DUF3422 domain-containing protein [Pseudomonadota bacterium]